MYHHCQTGGADVIRTAASKAAPKWMELPLPLSSAEMAQCCPCLFTSLGTDPASTVVTRGPVTLVQRMLGKGVFSTFSFYNGWLTLPHEVEDRPNIGRGLRGQTRDKCPLQSLSWPLYACHQLSLAGDLWEIQRAFAAGKDFTSSLR